MSWPVGGVSNAQFWFLQPFVESGESVTDAQFSPITPVL